MNSKPGQFGQSKNFAVGQITDGDFTDERYQMMFAHGKHFNVFDHDHFVVVFIKNGIVQNLCQKKIITNDLRVFNKIGGASCQTVT